MKAQRSQVLATAAVAATAPVVMVVLGWWGLQQWQQATTWAGSSALSALVTAGVVGFGALFAGWYALTAWALLGEFVARRLGADSARLVRLLGRHGAPALRRFASASALGVLAVGTSAGLATAVPHSPDPPQPVPSLLVPGAQPLQSNAAPEDVGWGAPPPGGNIPTERPDEPAQNPAGDTAVRVTVTAGDSLWTLTAAHSPDPGAEHIAELWPRVYEQNSAVIGADPHLIRPGQELVIPADVTSPVSQGTTS